MLFKVILGKLVLIGCLLSIQGVWAHPAELKQYHDSGKYLQEVSRKTQEAREYLEGQLRYGRKGRLAIVLEIDETALSNYNALEKTQFTQNNQALTDIYLLGQGTPISPIQSLYQYALKNKIAIFFVSSRPNTPEIRQATIQNLTQAGFSDWQDLILMPIEGSSFKIADYKTHTRSHISMQGYEILLNISAHEPDLQGGYAEIRVKLPNPFYLLS